ncbi:MAG: hypothetical protein RJA25_1995 [Bacteroidota bacterium]|jgi:hypothetical protein
MSFIDKIIGGNIFIDFWSQVQQYIFSSGRLRQLITLKPIEIYSADTALEIDTATVQLSIHSTIENLVQRRIERTINLLTLNLGENEKNLAAYNFDIDIKAFMPYEEVDKFFNKIFANETYPIEENKYYIRIDDFSFSNEGEKAIVLVQFAIKSARWFWKKEMKGSVILKGYLKYDTVECVIKTRNLHYELKTNSWMLELVDQFYHHEIIDFLSDFIQYNFKEELLLAREQAQEQITSFQSQASWLKGSINDLELENITLHPDGPRAAFLAKGKISLIN